MFYCVSEEPKGSLICKQNPSPIIIKMFFGPFHPFFFMSSSKQALGLQQEGFLHNPYYSNAFLQYYVIPLHLFQIVLWPMSLWKIHVRKLHTFCMFLFLRKNLKIVWNNPYIKYVKIMEKFTPCKENCIIPYMEKTYRFYNEKKTYTM